MPVVEQLLFADTEDTAAAAAAVGIALTVDLTVFVPDSPVLLLLH